MAQREKDVDVGMRFIWGLLLLALCLFTALSVFSYDWRDISVLKVPANTPPANLIGPVGAWMTFGLFMGIGLGTYLVPLWTLAFGLLLVLNAGERIWTKAVWLTALMLALTALFELNAPMWGSSCAHLNIPDAAGVFGRLLVRGTLLRWLNNVGTGILVWLVIAGSVVFLVGIPNLVSVYRKAVALTVAGVARGRQFLAERQGRQAAIERETRQIERRRRRLERAIERSEPEEAQASRDARGQEAGTPDEEETAGEETARSVRRKAARKRKRVREPARPEPVEDVPAATAGEYTLPPVSLLNEGEATGGHGLEPDTDTTSRILVETLAEFGIDVEATNVERGPVVTRYELRPAPGVRVERISGLSNNIALSLKAHSVRVQAPIPGKGVVGIEVPNEMANLVSVREIVSGDKWSSDDIKLPLVLGKDVAGRDLVADLADMPHLLIAGATGSGKTVCMNSILAGLLMARRPEELRFLLVDPKIVEFSVYNDLPHLVVPVVTDPKKVSIALRWAINEMENRYKLFARAGVRNIASYNKREIATQEDLFGDEEDGEEAPQEDGTPRRIPYIVIVIDELADLMLVDQAGIENAVARLAQLSRAVGIHMILSTQRPSVNVITGTIKANFPARIAFQVAQKVDSRTILDTVGAEKLLGRGDMLFLPPGSSKLVRAQGALSTDDEIRRITDFCKEQAEPDFEMDIKEKIEKKGGAPSVDDGEEDDELLSQAVEIIRETQRASTSSLQRRLRIGYTRAARIMDILEERGVVGPPRGSDPREILIDLDGDIPDNPTEPEG